MVLLGGRCSKGRVEKSTALSGNGEQERPDLALFVGFRLNRFVHDPLGTRSLGAVFGFVFFGLLCFSIGVLLTMRHVIALHAKGILPSNRACRTRCQKSPSVRAGWCRAGRNLLLQCAFIQSLTIGRTPCPTTSPEMGIQDAPLTRTPNPVRPPSSQCGSPQSLSWVGFST